MKITVHCLVKNEDRWIWFALKSVLPYAEKILVYDTGSSDKTVEIIKSINDKKIEFVEKGKTDSLGLVKFRQEMIDKTKTDWFLILDGDEIWPEDSIKNLLEKTSKFSESKIGVITPVRNCIGDVFHYLPSSAGNYHIGAYKGNLNIRLIRKTKNLKIYGKYPLEYYADKNGPIQNQAENLEFIDEYLIHTSFLQRSSVDKNKVSGSFGRSRIWQRGIKSYKNELPKVLLENYPKGVFDPLRKRGLVFEILALIFDPIIRLRRSL